MKKLLIIGAASAIAHETAKKFAAAGTELFLADLKLSRLEAVKSDILARHKTRIETAEFNAVDYENISKFFDSVIEKMNGLDGVLIAHGILQDNSEMEKDLELMLKDLNVNSISVIAFAAVAANYLEKKGSGTIAAISSVAGDRGRQSNYIYGTSKAAITTYLQGLRNRLSQSGVNVLTIKPGMVDTPMTAHMPKGPLFVQPEVIGKGIYEAMREEKDVVYLPAYWRLVMYAIRAIPEFIFKKLSL